MLHICLNAAHLRPENLIPVTSALSVFMIPVMRDRGATIPAFILFSVNVMALGEERKTERCDL